MKDLTATMDITMQEGEEGADGEEAADGESPATEDAKKEGAKAAAGAEKTDATASTPPPAVVVEDEKEAPKAQDTTPTVADATPAAAGTTHVPTPSAAGARTPSPSPSGTSKRHQIPLRPALMDKPSDELGANAESEESLRKKEKKKGNLTKEQREQLAAYDKERARVRQERVDTLARKLLDRISVWTETDKGADVTKAFQEKTRLEVENMKMESFGLDILHAIGQTYLAKATALLRSQKFLGIGGFFSRVKDKGTIVKETWNTISSAIDAQQTIEEMARMEEKGGEEWSEERKAEYERRVTGKILTAAWRGSKFEIQSVLREVCDSVLNDKKVPLAKRLERAEALVIIGEIFSKAQRSPEEEGDYLVFEQLVAEAAIKKDKESKKKGKKTTSAEVAEDAPNVPKPEKS
ncbi:DnaJ domain-containing protein [Colletotrichum graminicola]|nr:DnaJ domain-containing protein [Colletotrichum graminicola]